MHRGRRVDQVIDRVPPNGPQRQPDQQRAHGVDRLGPLRSEATGRQPRVEDRGGDPHLDVAALRVAGGRGDPRLRQPHDRDRHPAGTGEQQALLHHELAPRVADQPGRQHRPHQRDVRRRLVLDPQPRERPREVAEVLREHPHRRRVHDVLDPPRQRQLQHVSETARVHLADRRVRRHQVEIRRQVVHGVDRAGQLLELVAVQPELRLANVPGMRDDPRGERVVPDLRRQHGPPDPLEPVVRPGRAHQAVHRQFRGLPQQVGEHEPPDEPRRPGQEHGREPVRRDGRRERPCRGQPPDRALQELQVLLTLCGQARVRVG